MQIIELTFRNFNLAIKTLLPVIKCLSVPNNFWFLKTPFIPGNDSFLFFIEYITLVLNYLQCLHLVSLFFCRITIFSFRKLLKSLMFHLSHTSIRIAFIILYSLITVLIEMVSAPAIYII